MIYLGLELANDSSGIAGCLCRLNVTAGEADFYTAKTLDEMAALILAQSEAVLAVGSPLAFDVGTRGELKTRVADTALRKLEHPECLNPRFGPLPPELLRQKAMNGRNLVAKIAEKTDGLTIIETHAASTAEFLGLHPPWVKRTNLAAILEHISMSLPEFDFKSRSADHLERKAALNAVTAGRFHRNETVSFGEADEGMIYLPRPRAKLVILDVDGTLTSVTSPWRHIHRLFGVWDGIGELILQRWLAGEISYDTFCRNDIELWRNSNASLSSVESILDSIEIHAGAISLLRELHAGNLKLALLSSGFTRVAERICRTAGLDDKVIIIANRLFENGSGAISVKVKVSGDGNSRRSKGRHVRQLCSQLGISPVNCVGIGDGPSDRFMFERCGYSFLVRGSEELAALPDLIIPSPRQDNVPY